MGVLSFAVRLALAVVFAVAGAAKLADRSAAQDGLRGFGVPNALAGPLAVLLPAAELAVAGALLVPATAWWAAAAALALLLGFAAAIAANLTRGRTPPCHCFGTLHTAPTGASALARTGGLAILAGAVVALGRGSGDPLAAGALPSRPDAIVVGVGLAMLVMLAAGGALFVALAAQNGRLLARIEALERRLSADSRRPEAATGDGLPIGALAPAFTLEDTAHGATSLADLRAADRPIVLLFSDPGCGPCRALAPDISAWRDDHAGVLEILVLERRPDVARDYDAHATPTAVLVHADGTIGSRPAVGAHAIRDLVHRTAAGATPTDRTAATGRSGAVVLAGRPRHRRAAAEPARTP